jgi:hypothetical protein
MSDRNRPAISKKKPYGSGNKPPGLQFAVNRLNSRVKVNASSGVSREDIRKLIAYLESL